MRLRLPHRLLAALVLVLPLVLALALSAARADAADDAAAFRRGIGVHRPLNWANLSTTDSTRYGWPPFTGKEHAVSDRLIARIRESGFDFVRLTVDPGPFLQMTGERRDRLDDLLIAAIRRFRAHDLGVLVNFHSNSQVAAYRPEAIFTAAGTPLFQSYLAMVARTAARLAALHDPGVALEPVNEPPAGYDGASAARWQAMMEALYRAARAQAPRLPLVVTGAQGGSFRGLALLDPRPFRDANTLFSFHYYEPHLLTHQGVASRAPREIFWRDLRELTYPAHADDMARAWRATRARIEADPKMSETDKRRAIAAARDAITRYFREGWDGALIGAAFDTITAWAARYGIAPGRILLGEFGATREDSAADRSRALTRARWLHDVRCAAEQRHFRWSIWELNGSGGMAVTDRDDPDRIDPLTREALGLLASPSLPACPR